VVGKTAGRDCQESITCRSGREGVLNLFAIGKVSKKRYRAVVEGKSVKKDISEDDRDFRVLPAKNGGWIEQKKMRKMREIAMATSRNQKSTGKEPKRGKLASNKKGGRGRYTGNAVMTSEEMIYPKNFKVLPKDELIGGMWSRRGGSEGTISEISQAFEKRSQGT